MSSDYRPRGGSSSSHSGGNNGGPRRRRGGRGRGPGGGGRSSYSNNGSSYSGSSPKKPTGFWATIKSWFAPKKSSNDRPARTSTPRADLPPREPRADRPRRDDRPPKADPTPQEIVSPKLYVGNLSYDAGESDLFDLFSKVGAVKNVEIAMDHRTNRSKGFGFVEMETLETAKEASAKLNRTDFMSRQIVVSGAKVDRRVSSSPEASSESESESESTI